MHSFTVSDISTKPTLLKTILLEVRQFHQFPLHLHTQPFETPLISYYGQGKKEVQLQIILMKVLFLLVISEPVWPETLVFLQVRNLSRE